MKTRVSLLHLFFSLSLPITTTRVTCFHHTVPSTSAAWHLSSVSLCWHAGPPSAYRIKKCNWLAINHLRTVHCPYIMSETCEKCVLPKDQDDILKCPQPKILTIIEE